MREFKERNFNITNVIEINKLFKTEMRIHLNDVGCRGDQRKYKESRPDAYLLFNSRLCCFHPFVRLC